MRRTPALMIVAFIVSFAIIIALACVESLRRKTPINFIMLSLFTIAESYMIASFCARFDPETVSFLYNKMLTNSPLLKSFIDEHIDCHGGWSHHSRMLGSDYIRLPNQVGLYHDGRHSLCGGHLVIPVRISCNVLPWSYNDFGLFVLRCSSLLRLPNLRHSNDDGRNAQTLD